MTTQRDLPARAELFTFLGLCGVLISAAFLRQDFNGDGVRHVQAALLLPHPQFGEPRWLLFPTLAWVLVHPLASVGLVTRVEPAIRALVGTSVAAGIAYLWAIWLWLRGEGFQAKTRLAGLVAAAATMPFLVLYTDLTEVELAAASVVLALAVARARSAAGKTGEPGVLGLVALIGAASLVYQGLIVAMAFVPLVVPVELFRRRNVIAGWTAILVIIPAFIVFARTTAGDNPALAMQAMLSGESNPIARSSMAVARPMKWAAALVAGPPQAMIRLSNFQGLTVLANQLQSGDSRSAAYADLARLGVGLIIVWAVVIVIARTRDWKLALAMVALISLPVIRNSQYNYPKFYVLWPPLVALASAKFPPKLALVVGVSVLTLNGALLARGVWNGRLLHAEMETLFESATSDSCFFTSSWSAPLPYLWPGKTSGVISELWKAPEDAANPLTASIEACFCGGSRVWTDTVDDERETVQTLANHFRYTEAPVADLLYRKGDGLQVAQKPSPVFIYSPSRQADLCSLLTTR